MSAPVVLVVGASSGFGHLAASMLLRHGLVVYAAARRLEPMQALADQGASLLEMDVTDDNSVRAAIDAIMETAGRIDIVLNNAGYGAYGAAECVPLDEAMRQFDTNLFGAARVHNAVLPHMRRQGAGRLILTTSLACHVSPPGQGWYSASKQALNGLADAMRGELSPLNIHVIRIEPGPVQTGFEDVALAGMDQRAHPADYGPFITACRRFMAKTYAKAPGPESTARAMVHAVTSSHPKAVYRTTTDARILPFVRWVLGTALFGRILNRLIAREIKRP